MNGNLQKTNTENQLAFWKEKVEECKSSGLSQKQWCKENNIGKSAFSYWKKKVLENVKDQQESKFVEVPVMSSSSPISISCGEIKVDITDSSDSILIRNVIRALKSC